MAVHDEQNGYGYKYVSVMHVIFLFKYKTKICTVGVLARTSDQNISIISYNGTYQRRADETNKNAMVPRRVVKQAGGCPPQVGEEEQGAVGNFENLDRFETGVAEQVGVLRNDHLLARESN